MPYAVVQDMIDRFGQGEMIELTDRAEPFTGAVVDAIAQLALDDAEATVNSYVAKQATLPLTAVPSSFKRITCDIARYYLHDDAAEGPVKVRFDQAISQLRDISKGVIALPDNAGGEPITSDEILSTDSKPFFDFTGF